MGLVHGIGDWLTRTWDTPNRRTKPIELVFHNLYSLPINWDSKFLSTNQGIRSRLGRRTHDFKKQDVNLGPSQ